MSSLSAWALSMNADICVVPACYHEWYEYIVIFLPFVIGSVYFLYKWAYVLCGGKIDPWYDERPSRVWWAISALNLLLLPFGSLPLCVAIILLVFILFISNNDFGTSF